MTATRKGAASEAAARPEPRAFTGLTGYRAVLRHAPASLPFAASVVARLPVAMAPLGILLLVQAERGSYAVAGAITGAFACGTAVAGPAWGRLLDRRGQRWPVLITSLGSAAALAAFTAAAVLTASVAVLALLATIAGLLFPPVGPAMRQSWRATLAEQPLREAAYALDAAAVETIFVGGPLLLSVLTLAGRVPPLLVTAGLLAAGGAAYSALSPPPHRRQGTIDGAPGQRHGRGRGRPVAAAAGLPALLAVTAAQSMGFGQIDTSMAATARTLLHSQRELGLLFSAIAGGSAIGGLWYGGRPRAGLPDRRLAIALGIFAAMLLTLPAVVAVPHPPVLVLLPLLFATGLSIAPSVIMQQSLADRLAPADRLGEAQAWITAAATTGSAAGTALGGILVDRLGVPVALLGAAVIVALAAGLAVGSARRWRQAADAVDRDQLPAGPLL